MVVACRLWVADIAPALQPDWSARESARLSRSEAARLARLERPRRRAQFLAGHVLLRRLVARQAGLPEEEVLIDSAASGRPEIGVPRGWQASLAHSGAWAAALVAAGPAAVGVDLEQMAGGRDIGAIVQAVGAPLTASREEAYLAWAGHEAALKAGVQAAAAWLAQWNDYAFAVCAGAPPEVAVVDLASAAPERAVALAWSASADGRTEDGLGR